MSKRRKPGNPGLKGKLLEKSIEAYILSLETINRLSAKYRVESFLVLLCNSWELLLKAKIIDTTGKRESIYYKTKAGKPPRTLSLEDCLHSVFPNEADPTRRNLNRITELRNEATHLVISQVPKGIIGLFQASVLNYHKCLIDSFGISLSERVPAGMMAIVYDFSPDQIDPNNAVIRRRLGRETAQYLANLQDEIGKEFEELGKPAEFAVGIDYRLVLTKKPGESDITLATGSDGTACRVLEVPRIPTGRTHTAKKRQSPRSIRASTTTGIRSIGTIFRQW